MKKPTTALLTLMLVVAAGQCAFAADLLAVYREASLQDAVYGSAKAQYIAAQERLPQARYDLVVANQERARQDLENARRSVALQTRQAYLGVTSGLAQVKALQQAVASTQLQLESTKLGQEVGVRTAVDVLNAEQQLSAARRDLSQALYNTILNQLRLKAAVGKLAEADLSDINALLKDGAR